MRFMLKKAYRQICLLSLLLFGHNLSFAAQSQMDFAGLFAQQATTSELTQLTQLLTASPQAKGEFTQYRYLKVLKQPLVSKGSFVFSKPLGIVWQQRSPFSNTLILQAGSHTQIDSQGQMQVSKAQQSNHSSQLAQLMPTVLKALLSGDLQTLQQHFSLSVQHASNNEQPWQLGLTPLDPMLQKAMPRLVLIGAKQIQTLIIYSDAKDHSRIEFSAIDEQVLTAQDLARFSPAQPHAKPREIQ